MSIIESKLLKAISVVGELLKIDECIDFIDCVDEDDYIDVFNVKSNKKNVYSDHFEKYYDNNNTKNNNIMFQTQPLCNKIYEDNASEYNKKHDNNTKIYSGGIMDEKINYDNSSTMYINMDSQSKNKNNTLRRRNKKYMSSDSKITKNNTTPIKSYQHFEQIPSYHPSIAHKKNDDDISYDDLCNIIDDKINILERNISNEMLNILTNSNKLHRINSIEINNNNNDDNNNNDNYNDIDSILKLSNSTNNNSNAESNPIVGKTSLVHEHNIINDDENNDNDNYEDNYQNYSSESNEKLFDNDNNCNDNNNDNDNDEDNYQNYSSESNEKLFNNDNNCNNNDNIDNQVNAILSYDTDDETVTQKTSQIFETNGEQYMTEKIEIKKIEKKKNKNSTDNIGIIPSMTQNKESTQDDNKIKFIREDARKITKDFSEIAKRLDVIHNLTPGYKLWMNVDKDTEVVTFEIDNSLIPSISRYYNGQNRRDIVNRIVDDSNFITKNINKLTPQGRDSIKKKIELSINGLKNIKDTYIDEEEVTDRLSCVISRYQDIISSINDRDSNTKTSE